jgi:phage baseplate assembly protein W
MASNIDTNSDFLGRGWSFPPNFDRVAGGVDLTEREEDIDRSLQILLTTTAGERVMEPKYGCNLESLLFEPMDTATQTFIKDKIKTAILFFEPRINATGIDLDTDRLTEGLLLIRIEYLVKSTNSRFNFVFPFYRNEGTEIGFLTGNQPPAL